MAKKFDFQKLAMNALAIIGGAGLSGLLDSMALSKISNGTLDPKIKGLIKIGGGAFIPGLFPTGKKGGDLLEKGGDGMIAIGGYQLLHAFLPAEIPAISGIGCEKPSTPPVAGTPLNTLSGPQQKALDTLSEESEDPNSFLD